MKYKFLLHDTKTGIKKWIEQESSFEEYKKNNNFEVDQDDMDDSILFMWLEGNYSCDCNRSIFLYKKGYDDAYECSGNTNIIDLLKIVREDEKIIYDMKEHDNYWY